MRIIDILKSDECSAIFSEVNKFVTNYLSQYNENIEKDNFSFQEKDIFDLVWGTVELSSAEICVLDSPILQRLRKINQLGMASIVYCNADHSRFSHTIGVLEVAGRMASIVTKKLEKKHPYFSFNEIVRLAALFHDAGHLCFSHVSESYFTYDLSFPRHEEVTKARTFFCEKTSSSASLHELLSVMIVNSDEVVKLIKLLSKYALSSKISKDEHCEQFIEYISCLIIGRPIDKWILPYSMIINSTIDADKLDYLSRDSACTKVPIAVDIARIIQKLDIVPIEKAPYSEVWNDYSGDNMPLYMMALKNSAKKVFWQLSFARSMMFESVYHHHKVLTAETMFRIALSKICAENNENLSFDNLLKITDDYFGEFFIKILIKESKQKSLNSSIANEILGKIRNRNLYKRVASFSKNSILAPVEMSKVFIDKVIKNPFSDEHEKFKAEMIKEYEQIRKILGYPDISKVPIFIFIESTYEEMNSMPFENGNGYFIWSSSIMKQETMEAGRQSKQEQYYLVTDSLEREIVYLALEKVVTNFGIKSLLRESSICAKFTIEQINRKRNILFEANYYNNYLYLLPDDLFKQLYDSTKFKAVFGKFQTFNGVNNCKVTEESLYLFLKQFLIIQCSKAEIMSILDGILRILNSSLFINRECFVTNTTELLKKITELKFRKNYIIGLGGLFDSSKHLTYYINDIKEKKDFIFIEQLETILNVIEIDDSLTFFDDGAYSGKQVVSIFQEYMGIPKDERTTNEHHVDELSDQNKEKLKNVHIILAYLCFNPNSSSYIEESLKKLGIKGIKIEFCYDLSTKIFDRVGIFKDAKQIELLKRCLYDIGKKILLSRNQLKDGSFKERWNLTRIENSALGYNDAQQMVVFESNIPTYSICAFWTSEKDDATNWKGLFQRTLKD